MGKLLSGCGTISLVLLIVGTCSSIFGGGSSKATPTPVTAGVLAAGPTATLGPTATVGPTATPVATPTYAPSLMYVGNTGGDGVALRKAPGSDERLKAWPDRTAMTVTGWDELANNERWKPVKDPDGNSGWIKAEYLLEPTPTPAPTSTPDRSRYKLELLASRGTIEYNWATVTGQVKNISGESLRAVDALVEWYTADGQFISSDSALIEYNPILPGQTSPFEVMTRYNPAMKKYTVSFKYLLGGSIVTLDSTKR